ncbi:DUF6257 family protein [Streptomyces shenzhenensis]|uniref:DUF6257 family protein n=1 Tax=Streptomyces shenzhenensis TaxID=943815 RepID=UPI001F3CD46B|nr:DUF6257 family protein [Streptomyces shenzhenensis]
MAADDLAFADFTLGERLRLAGLTARMAKRGLADDGTGNVDVSDLKRRIERIENDALKRKAKPKPKR